jgi:hypothetical protein
MCVYDLGLQERKLSYLLKIYIFNKSRESMNKLFPLGKFLKFFPTLYINKKELISLESLLFFFCTFPSFIFAS